MEGEGEGRGKGGGAPWEGGDQGKLPLDTGTDPLASGPLAQAQAQAQAQVQAPSSKLL